MTDLGPQIYTLNGELPFLPTSRPLTFDLIRNGDESGVSGTGKVLEGVIFADNTCVVRWVAVNAAQSTVVYDNSVSKVGEDWDDDYLNGFEKFFNIHVRSHPGNNVEINFYDRFGNMFTWKQPEAKFEVDKESIENAARFVVWAVQQPWFRWPK